MLEVFEKALAENISVSMAAPDHATGLECYKYRLAVSDLGHTYITDYYEACKEAIRRLKEAN